MHALQPFVKLTVLGVGVLLGQTGIGPAGLTNLSLPLGELVDSVFHGYDRARRTRVRALCTCLADELATKARHRDPETVEAARLVAEDLLATFGLSERRLVALGLDAGKAADDLLAHARFTADERLEVAPLCRELLACFYERLKEQHDFIQELLPAIYARLLADQAEQGRKLDAVGERLAALPATLRAEVDAALAALHAQ